MSNGPCSPVLSFQSGTLSTVASCTSSGDSMTKTWRKPSFRRPRSDRRSCDDWLRTTCGPKSRSGRSRFRSWQTRSGKFKTTATGRQWYCRASSTSGLRASGWTLVASMTVSRPRASRLPVMKRRTSKASLVMAWSFSSSETIPRQKSEERTSVGLKCFLAKVLLPEPLGPIKTTRLSLGMVINMERPGSGVSRTEQTPGQIVSSWGVNMPGSLLQASPHRHPTNPSEQEEPGAVQGRQGVLRPRRRETQPKPTQAPCGGP